MPKLLEFFYTYLEKIHLNSLFQSIELVNMASVSILNGKLSGKWSRQCSDFTGCDYSDAETHNNSQP